MVRNPCECHSYRAFDQRINLALNFPGSSDVSTQTDSLRISTGGDYVSRSAEDRGPSILEFDFLLEPALQQSLDSLLRLRPRQCGLKGGEGVEEPIGG